MIKPTVGRMVWFWEGVNQAQPMAAIVTLVHNDHMVNLSVFDSCGVQFSRTCVRLVQGDEAHIPAGHVPVGAYCEWMPYQVGQAKKDAIPGDPPVGTVKLATAVTDAMVSRFLAWELPEDFSPDQGIRFTGVHGAKWPTGTNLLHAGQARAMLEHVIGADPARNVLRSPAIEFTPHEIQSGSTRVDWAEGLIRQLPETHDGRNSWLLNYGSDKAERQAAWAERNPNSSLAHAINLGQATVSAPDTRPNPEKAAPAPSVEPENKQLTDQLSQPDVLSARMSAADMVNAFIEAEIVAKGLTAPRVTPDMISRVIHDSAFHFVPDTQITVCVITLTNGTKLLGYNYGSIDPDDQDWEQGRNSAYNMAREKIWELEGYALRERLTQGGAA